MKTEKVRFYLSYASPYCYFAFKRAPSIFEKIGIEVEYEIKWTEEEEFTGTLPWWYNPDHPKLKYYQEDVNRHASDYGFTIIPMVDGKASQHGAQSKRAFLVAREYGVHFAFSDRMFDAYWLSNLDIDDDDVIGDIVEELGKDRLEFLKRLNDENHMKPLVEKSVAQRDEDGAFGIPFFVYKGQKYWGNDRIDRLVSDIKAQ